MPSWGWPEMRNAFADELTRLAAADPRIVLLSGDIGNRLFDRFKAAQPARFVNCGVAEQNMMGVAAGLALSGFRPVVYTIAPFATTRCLEQIRTDAAYHDAPVTVVAVGAGLSYAGLGPTHHACEDMAFLRAIPNMTVVAPGDPWEVRAALGAVLRLDGPAYLRLGKKGEPTVHPGPLGHFDIGEAITVAEGRDVCLLVAGTLLPDALEAGRLLETRGISARVVSFHTVKPLDAACLTDAFRNFSRVVTLEEHSLIGGLGGAIAEWAVDTGSDGTRLLRIGTPDGFFKQSGDQAFARRQLGLDAHGIAERIEAALKRGRAA